MAIPSLNGSSQKSGNFSYVWTKDGEGQPDASGWGKSYFIFSPSYLDENNTVESEVSNISGSVNMSGKISLNPFSPKIIFYEKDPVFGVKWEKSLSNGFKISPQGGVLFVAPYFFSPNSVNSRELSFGWSVNGEDVNTPVTKNVLSVKPESGQTGTATVKAVITNTKTLFQTLEKELNVIF